MAHADEINVNADSDLQDRDVYLERNFRILRDLLTPEPWHIVGNAGEPAFENGWINYDIVTEPGAQFYKFLDRCIIRGAIKDGTLDVAAFTLPATYLPADDLHFPCLAVKGSLKLGHVSILKTGEVIPSISGAGADFLFPEIMFRLADS